MTFVTNKRFSLKYTALEEYVAGIELSGPEVKSLREKKGSLEGARIIVRGGEAFLVGMSIPPYQKANTKKEYDEARTRRLLLAKAEIAKLADAESKKGLTIVPIELYNFHNLIKVKLAIVRGKKKGDRREELKKKDAERERARILKNR